MKIYTNKSKAKPSYCVAWKNLETGKRERRTFVDMTEANEQLENVKKFTAVVAGIKENLTPLQITNFGIQQKRLGDIPITEAVDYYLRNYRKEVSTPPFIDIANEYLREKKNQTYLNPVYLSSMEAHVLKAVESFPTEIGKITRENIQQFIDSNWTHPITKNNVRRSLIGLFRWAKLKKQCLPNTYETAPESVAFNKVAALDPQIYSPEELNAILRIIIVKEPALISFIATAAFTGIRCTEICRIDWEKVNWDEKIIPLSADITKTKRRRLVPMPDCMLAWFDKLELRPPTAICIPENPQGRIRRLIEPSGLVLKKNGFRHSFASYHLALYNNSGLTSQVCGHSPQILETHYKSIQLDDGRFITKELAEKWFSIVP